MLRAAEMTVSELNLAVDEAIRRDPRLQDVTVRGEVSGFKHHLASGHWYFALKDAEAAVNCVMFRQNNLRSLLKPKDGDSVVVTGYVKVYARSGACQLYVTGMRSAGTGDLHQRFEELKRKLNAEGLFDQRRKRPLPLVPRKVAVVTSRSGAAIHDILNVSGARNPAIPIVVVPATVQGAGAAEEIAAGIRRAQLFTDADVIIVARGGGSAEDLWCFNEEIVARAVAESRVPVVSGVGHEVDVSICDLAADVRAATPSNAAEIVFPDRKELAQRIHLVRMGLHRAGESRLREAERKAAEVRARLGALSPDKRIAGLLHRTALAREKLKSIAARRMESSVNALRDSRNRLETAAERRLEKEKARAALCRERLKALNPLDVLGRGYALVYSRDGRMLKTAAEAAAEGKLRIRFADGIVPVAGKEEDA
ncbi:MAG: exodeoxyribonuclease VII large subunit [Clostridia bacterium]|nr:exodeoxyribonuclease VII large subunit [Clostridia bacterium]